MSKPSLNDRFGSILSANNSKRKADVERLVHKLSKSDINELILYMRFLGYNITDVCDVTQFMQDDYPVITDPVQQADLTEVMFGVCVVEDLIANAFTSELRADQVCQLTELIDFVTLFNNNAQGL